MKTELGQIIQLLKMMKGLKKVHEGFIKDVASEYKLSGGQLDLLWVISHRDGLTVTEASELGLLHISTAMHLISLLQERGLVTRKNAINDKRTWHVFVTEEGKKIIDDIISKHDVENNSILKAVKKVAQEQNMNADEFIQFGLSLVKELNGEEFYDWVNQNSKQVPNNSSR